MKLALNAGYCAVCDQVLLSLHRHDFRTCVGNHGFVDGGSAYLRTGGNIVNIAIVLEDGKLRFADENVSSAIARVSHPGSRYSLVGG